MAATIQENYAITNRARATRGRATPLLITPNKVIQDGWIRAAEGKFAKARVNRAR